MVSGEERVAAVGDGWMAGRVKAAAEEMQSTTRKRAHDIAVAFGYERADTGCSSSGGDAPAAAWLRGCG